MTATNFNTANQTYRMLMGNGLIYTVPRFQRDYSWGSEEWEDLWLDILEVMQEQEDASHYMGYLVLQSKDSKNFDIIDGQQRLTTISIIVLAVLANLQKLIDSGTDPLNNKRRQEQLRNSLIGYLDPVTLISKSKLNLNRNNDKLYQDYLVPLQPLPKRGLKATEHQMRKAFEWWESRTYSAYKSGEELARFIDRLIDKLLFTVITVSDELNAYKVFETLNARGVKLSSTDLLKNYLFSVVHAENRHEHKLRNLEQRWEELVGKLGSESFPDFLRTHWNSRHKFVRHAELFKRIRNQITSRQQVFELIRDMLTDADTYVALSKPEDELWTSDQKRYIDEIRMFNVRQVYPLLLAAYRNLNDRHFSTLLKTISSISFRYNVISNNPPNEQERVYNQIAERIEKHKLSLSEILGELKVLYVPDKEFRYAFAAKVLKTTQSQNKRIARFTLAKIEEHLSGILPDHDSDRFNIEHILPENVTEEWDDISELEHEQFVYRLGNLCLLESSANNRIGNEPFEVKKAAYTQSEFQIPKRVAAENSSWDPSRIERQQNWMAEQVKTIWRVSQYD